MRSQQFEQDWLADQALEGNGRAGGQGSDPEAEWFAQGFFATYAFGQQDIGAERRRQPEQTVILRKVWGPQFRSRHGI